MRIVFLGTPDFATVQLKALVENGYNIVGVFTQPDKPAGRGKKLTPPPVKTYAQEQNIPVFQFNKIKSPEGVEALKSLKPDLLITAAFGQLLSQEILDIPPLGCINVHASLLPKYRGAAPIQWAIIKGETVTGITTMLTDIGMDTGDMLLSEKIDIKPAETAGELFDRLAVLGAQVLLKTLQQLADGTLKRTPQDHSQATVYPPIKKEMAHINWEQNASDLINFARGLNPFPVAFTKLGDEVLKVYEMSFSNIRRPGNAVCGEVVAASAKEGLHVAAINGVVRLNKIKAAGTKILNDTDYLNGHAIKVGTILN